MSHTTQQKQPENPYAKAYADFTSQVGNHTLTVLHDDGMYRHLRVQAPGTRMWSWDITTWPGHLATSGDIADGYMFTREPDMLSFFRSAGRGRDNYYSDGAPSIDIRYWAEKLCGGRSREVKRYDEDTFIQQVREQLEEHETLGAEAGQYRDRQLRLLRKLYEMRGLDEALLQSDLEALWIAESTFEGLKKPRPYSVDTDRDRNAAKAKFNALWSVEDISDEQHKLLCRDFDWMEYGDTRVSLQAPVDRRNEILSEARDYAGSENEAHSWLSENSDIFGEDTWEWDLRDYDIHFLFTCYAIDMAVRLYFAQHQSF